MTYTGESEDDPYNGRNRSSKQKNAQQVISKLI